MARQKGFKTIADNRRAFHEYHILDRFEAGIALSGTEVKSLRAGRVNLSDSYAQVKNGEIFVIGMHISPYEQGNRFNLDPIRNRKLLMHKREINKLYGQTKQNGLTLVPTRLYFKDGRVKLEIALAKGKKDYDKRQSEIKKSADREIAQRLKSHG